MGIRKLLAGILLVAAGTTATAQLTYYRYDSITVVDGNDTLILAWAGGFNSPQFSDIDLNGDSLKDLFVFDRKGFVVKTFINLGTAGEVDYRYAPEYIPLFPKMHDFALLEDYNCDGYEDIFTYSVAGMAVYRNDYAVNDTLAFTMMTPQLKFYQNSFYINAYVTSADIPALIDLDNDGDLDILSFGVFGTMVEFYENLSMDSVGVCDSLFFRRADACWGKFFESSQGNDLIYPINCRTSGNQAVYEPVDRSHSGSALLSLDTDQDGDKELVLGDISFPNLVIAINGGDPDSAQITADDTLFPKNFTNTIAVDLNYFPAGYYVDVNNDSVKDLLVSPNAPNISENLYSAWYYSNSGMNDLPDFQFVKKDFLQDEMIELGEGANPVFFDANADTLLDLIVGNYGYYNSSGNYPSGLAYYRNTGTATDPAYELVTTDYMGITSFGTKGVYPAFGDMDDDGDEDMIIGAYDGYLHYYENTAGAGNPANFVLAQGNYMNIDIGDFAAPQIVDVNRDGVLDLLVGEKSGTLNYFQNMGNTQVPLFTDTATNDFFGEVDAMVLCCSGYSSPCLTELDSGGDYYLFLGIERGKVLFYSDIDGNLNGAFTLVDSLDLYSYRVSLSAADIDGDAIKELVIGEYGAGIFILKTDQGGPPVDIIEPIVNLLPDFNLYPNPAQTKLMVQFEQNTNQPLTLEVIDMLGRPVYKMRQSNISKGKPLQLDLNHLKAGLYFVKATVNGQSKARRFIKL